MSAEAIECTTSDVATLLRARTYTAEGVDPENPLMVVAGGELKGDFTFQTRPTSGQVEEHVEQAAIEVRARIGQDIEDESLLAYAQKVVALRAAMGVELSYAPEQANPEDSIYSKLQELYEKGLAALIAALPDTSSTGKGFYSLRTRSDVAGVFPTDALLP